MKFAVFFVVGLLLAPPASPNFVGLSVNLGSTVTLPCDGAPGKEVEWYFKQPVHGRMLVAKLHTGAFSPGSSFQGRVESFHLTEPGNYSLNLSPVVYSDLGFYECCYKDGTNNILKDVRLNILVPSLVSVEMGMPASLPCFGNIDKRARAGDLDILWTRGGQKVYHLHKNTITYGLGFENRVSLSPEQALHGNLSLTIKQTQSSDEGDYQCTYNNTTERGKPDFATLAFAAPPASPNFVGLSVNLGSTVTLPCDGAPGKEVEWYFKQPVHGRMLVAKLHTGAFSPGSSFQGRVESFHLTEPGNYSLNLSPVVYSDLGFYECCYKDGTNNILKDVRLNILVPSLVSVEMGMPASLPCFGNIDKRARAGDLDILWTRGGQKVYHLHKNTITYGLGFENRVSLSPEQALHGNLSLTIKQTQSSDEGDYQCTYNNTTERGKPDFATLAFAASTGFSAAEVAGMVLGLIVLLLTLVGSAFAIWKCLNNRKRAKAVVSYQAASAEDQKDSNSRAACILIPDGPEPPLSVSETQPALPEPHLPVSEKDPSFPELHLPEPETEQIDVQEKKSKSVELL